MRAKLTPTNNPRDLHEAICHIMRDPDDVCFQLLSEGALYAEAQSAQQLSNYAFENGAKLVRFNYDMSRYED